MSRTTAYIFFFIVTFIDVIGIINHNEWLQWMSKPLIVPAVALSFMVTTNSHPSALKKFIYGALFFSWSGDVLLMFDNRAEIFFLLGLSSFLIAHLFYIGAFHFIRRCENVSKIWYIILVAGYYAFLITLLSPYLGDKKIPVRVYGLVISFMLFLALHMMHIRNRKAGLSITAGALLFILSDSLLAINKFYTPVPLASVWVIVTYAFAQLLIAGDAASYIVNLQDEAQAKNLQLKSGYLQ